MNDQTRDCIWVTLFPILATGICEGLLPTNILLQFSILPLWATWFLLTRGPKKGLWITLWFGLMLESSWMLAPGTCILFFLACWAVIHSIQEILPDKFNPGFGSICGMILVPLLHLWCSLYTLLSCGASQAYPWLR
jgi:hypothetical protein